MATDYKALGKRISNARKQAGITQEALGEQLNMTRKHISVIESAIKRPSLDSNTFFTQGAASGSISHRCPPFLFHTYPKGTFVQVAFPFFQFVSRAARIFFAISRLYILFTRLLTATSIPGVPLFSFMLSKELFTAINRTPINGKICSM